MVPLSPNRNANQPTEWEKKSETQGDSIGDGKQDIGHCHITRCLPAWPGFRCGHGVKEGCPTRLVNGYILPIGWLYATYHLFGEPETTIDLAFNALGNFPMDLPTQLFVSCKPCPALLTIRASMGFWWISLEVSFPTFIAPALYLGELHVFLPPAPHINMASSGEWPFLLVKKTKTWILVRHPILHCFAADGINLLVLSFPTPTPPKTNMSPKKGLFQ